MGRLALVAAGADFEDNRMPLAKVEDEAERKKTRTAFLSGHFHAWAERIEKQILGPYVSGTKLHVADIKLFVIAHSMSCGVFDHFPRDVLVPFPKLNSLYQAVGNDPRIAAWRAR